MYLLIFITYSTHMQNIRQALSKYEELEKTAQWELKLKYREEMNRLQRVILFFTKPSAPVREHQIEYEARFTL